MQDRSPKIQIKFLNGKNPKTKLPNIVTNILNSQHGTAYKTIINKSSLMRLSH